MIIILLLLAIWLYLLIVWLNYNYSFKVICLKVLEFIWGKFKVWLSNEISTAILVLVGTTISVSFITVFGFNSIEKPLGLYNDTDFLTNILVESHGMILDILIIGVFILWLNKKREDRSINRKLQEEIDDFRPWRSEEASFRISGIIKRLNSNGISAINLRECFLKNAHLKGVNLKNASLWGADLGRANLNKAILINAKIKGAYLGDVQLKSSSLQGCYLKNSKFPRAQLTGSNLSDADLSDVGFWGADLKGAIFKNADLANAQFHYANLRSANLLGAKNLTSDQLLQAASLHGSQIDEKIKEEIEQKRPQLLLNKSLPLFEINDWNAILWFLDKNTRIQCYLQFRNCTEMEIVSLDDEYIVVKLQNNNLIRIDKSKFEIAYNILRKHAYNWLNVGGNRTRPTTDSIDFYIKKSHSEEKIYDFPSSPLICEIFLNVFQNIKYNNSKDEPGIMII